MSPTRTVVSIAPTAAFSVTDTPLVVGGLRRAAIQIADVTIEVGAHGHASDVEIIAFADSLAVAVSELRLEAVRRLAIEQDAEVLAQLADDDHFAGRPPLSPVVAAPWDATPFPGNGRHQS